MKNFLKFILSIILIISILSMGILIPVLFIYYTGKNFILDIQEQTKQRALEIGIALNTMGGESIYYDNMISLSNVMSKIVEHANTRNDPYKIKEIFLLDKNNKLIAHSNIIQMAKDFQSNYTEDKFKYKILIYENPLEIEAIGYVSFELSNEKNKQNKIIENIYKIIFDYVKKYLPELLANQFHVSGSVYVPDESLPQGTLHIIIENYGIYPLVMHWLHNVVKVTILGVFSFIVIFILFIIFLIQFYKKYKEIFEEIIEIPEKKDLPEDEFQIQENDFNAHELDSIIKKEPESNIINLKDYKKLSETRKENKKSITENTITKIENHTTKQEDKEKNIQNNKEIYENIMDALPLD